MAPFEVSSPSPPGRVHTPGTPKHGYGDPWEPYSPRKSARISAKQQQQRANERTPSPRSSSHHPTRASRRTNSSNTDTFTTPTTSPQKRRQPAMDSVRRASNALTAESAANATEFLGIGTSGQKSKINATSSKSAMMLPTPAKTPQQKPDEKSKANVRAIARNLFPSDADFMPTPKKRKAKKYTGLTLDSFRAEDVEEPIEIFTDTRDRIPEVDSTTDNPFYDNQVSAPVPEPSKKRSKQKHVMIPGEGKQTIEEAVRRSDGIVYVFRGKKIFRKFASVDDTESTSQSGVEAEVDAEFRSSEALEISRPLTRSSVKPRLLFPSKQKGKETSTAVVEDEEADTEIEDHVLNDVDDQVETPATPIAKVAKKPDTPEAPRFAPASPPTTVRATRSGDKPRAEDSPMKKPVKPRSPFDGWRRSKSRAGSRTLKREGEALPRSNESSKRQRA
ncbi:hypothetical protein AAE478_008029 [Parahypoxylon ruwenzoriense]